ncbi:hypothetical protein KI387_042603 [Taxus chinensis]|uniref:Uncharacterized protein n=1 Tax=Taxus chinensis TaxID=29808 RepID=A0AA38F803_TAXCH|nr:hypothetical protein KI387_042603 [Taxus chinensis]
MAVMMSSQGIGLITVIAVSGCSVVLLMLGRQKLVELRKDYSKAEQEREGGLGLSLSSQSFNTYSLVGHPLLSSTKHGTSISWRINLDIPGASRGSEDFSRKTPNSAMETCSQDKKRNVVKKVRFCEDVVEPSGNSAEYRRRHHQHALASRSGGQNANNLVCSRKKQSPPNNKECRMPPNRMALYNGIFHDRSQRALLY